jgi:hypothetical protein
MMLQLPWRFAATGSGHAAATQQVLPAIRRAIDYCDWLMPCTFLGLRLAIDQRSSAPARVERPVPVKNRLAPSRYLR